MRNPVRINVKAPRWSAPNEKIIEIGAGTKGAGCLLSITYYVETDHVVIDAYRGDRVTFRTEPSQ